MDTRYLRSSTFRLALMYMLLFTSSVLVLLGFIYWSTVSYLSAQTDATIEYEILDLTDRYQHTGLTGLTQLLTERLSRRPAGASVYLLTDSNLVPLIGNLDSWPVSADIQRGWLEFDLKNTGADAAHRARARLFRLSGGFLLLVGRDIHEFEITRHRISMSLFWGLGIMLILGGLGSIMMGRSTLQRIETINQTSREIMSGDLSRRIPSRGTGDDFDTLADNLNAMLDQIESLMESVRRVSDNIAHDLRTPLARLRNRLEELRLDTDAGGPQHAVLEQALEEADALLNTFNALLSIARIESQDDASHFTPVDMGALIRDVMELYEPLAEDKGLHFMADVRTPLIFHGDRDLLFQALANLLDNAIKYTPPAGLIQLTLEQDGDAVCLRLCDSGPGIPEDQREQVFQRFFRLEQSRTTPGNGLGMSLVQAVMHRHRLDLQLQDHHPGLCVRIRFPASATA
jgi:signal transduction histidine kinase